jgi:hypothetical protein
MSSAHTKRRKAIAKQKLHFGNIWLQKWLSTVDQIRTSQAEEALCAIKGTVTSVAALSRHDSAHFLHLSPNQIPILLRAQLLHSSARSEFGPRIWISTDELLRVASDRDWRAKANAAVRAHQELKEDRRRAHRLRAEKKAAEARALRLASFAALCGRAATSSIKVT